MRTTPAERLESSRPARACLTSGRSLRRTSFASLRFWSKAAAKDRFQAESVVWSTSTRSGSEAPSGAPRAAWTAVSTWASAPSVCGA